MGLSDKGFEKICIMEGCGIHSGDWSHKIQSIHIQSAFIKQFLPDDGTMYTMRLLASQCNVVSYRIYILYWEIGHG